MLPHLLISAKSMAYSMYEIKAHLLLPTRIETLSNYPRAMSVPRAISRRHRALLT